MSDHTGVRPSDGGDPPMVELRNVSKRFVVHDSLLHRLFGGREYLRAVDDVSLSIHEGETVGLVGESGCGKSTLADLVTGLCSPTSGEVRFDGESVGSVGDRPVSLRTDIGLVFQEPRESINPRRTVRQTLAEPLEQQGWSSSRQRQRVDELLELVRLPTHHADSYPHQLSGGQIQRVALARALALEPQLVVLDEPVSALDMSMQAQLLNLLMVLQDRLGLTYLFISHDLDVVEHVADRVAVMYLGELLEIAPAKQLFSQPSHPYTQALLDAVPSPRFDDEPTPIPLTGDVPDATDPPTGCRFHPRCPVATSKCTTVHPEFEHVDDARTRCLFATEFVTSSESITEESNELGRFTN